MPRYRKRPAIVEATRMDRKFVVETLEGTMVGKQGDWLIVGIEGEQYPCDDSIFRKSYEPVDNEALKEWTK